MAFGSMVGNLEIFARYQQCSAGVTTDMSVCLSQMEMEPVSICYCSMR